MVATSIKNNLTQGTTDISSVLMLLEQNEEQGETQG